MSIGSGDFNGDGNDDILWQNDNGQAAIWLMNGTSLIGSAPRSGRTPARPGMSIGSGDFNGDGNDDILWQNDNGQAAIWLMNGTSLIGGAVVGPNPGPSWHVIGSGDFNGDGNDDILWQNDNGQAAIWLMNGTSLIGGAAVGPNPGPSWHVHRFRRLQQRRQERHPVAERQRPGRDLADERHEPDQRRRGRAEPGRGLGPHRLG